MSEERVLRNTTTANVALVFAVLAVLGAADAIRYAFAHSGTFSSKTLSDQWLLAAFLLLGAAYAILRWRTRVVVTPGSPTFTVKNSFTTRQLAWSDVEGIESRRVLIGGGASGRSYVVKVRLRGGRTIRCSALGGVGDTPLNLQSELESLRTQATAHPPGTAR